MKLILLVLFRNQVYPAKVQRKSTDDRNYSERLKVIDLPKHETIALKIKQ